MPNYTASSVQIQIVSNGGPVKNNTWRNGANALVAGQFVTKQASGTLEPSVAGNSLDAIVLTDEVAGTAGFVAIQEVTPDTIFEVQLSSDEVPDATQLGTTKGLVVTNGIVSVAGSGADLTVVDIGKNYDRATHTDADLNGFVKVKLA